jgi:hypothetical protein
MWRSVWLQWWEHLEDKDMLTDSFSALSQNCENLLLAASHLSVRIKQLGFHLADFHEI